MTDPGQVTGLERQILAVERVLQIRCRDLVFVVEHVDTLERGDIEQDTAREERA